MEKQHNILQYEFFHVGGNDSRSLAEAMTECAERIAETLPLAMAGDDTGSGIKTVVRIYDTDDRVTNLAIEMKKLEGARTTCCRFSRSNPFTFWYARWHIGRLDRGIASLKKQMVTYFTNYIRASIKSGAPAARESWDHAFRPIRRNEYIELRHAATVATGLWLFIFKPNDLLADNNELIVSTL